MTDMRKAYAAMFLVALGLIFGIVEKQGDPVREHPTIREAMVIPCSTWICKGGYQKCKEPTNRRCTAADFRGM